MRSRPSLGGQESPAFGRRVGEQSAGRARDAGEVRGCGREGCGLALADGAAAPCGGLGYAAGSEGMLAQLRRAVLWLDVAPSRWMLWRWREAAGRAVVAASNCANDVSGLITAHSSSPTPTPFITTDSITAHRATAFHEPLQPDHAPHAPKAARRACSHTPPTPRSAAP